MWKLPPTCPEAALWLCVAESHIKWCICRPIETTPEAHAAFHSSLSDHVQKAGVWRWAAAQSPHVFRDTGSLRPWRLPSLCLTRESQLGARCGVHSQSLGSSQHFVHLFCYVLIFYQVLSTWQFKGVFLLNSLEYVLFGVVGFCFVFLFFLTGLQNVFKIHCAKDVQKSQDLIFFITLHFGDYGINKDFFTWHLVPFSHSWHTQRQLGRMLPAFSLP